MEKYIQPFVDVSQSVFRDFIGSEVTVGRPYFMGKDDNHDWDVSGIIGLTGEARGAVVISMASSLALRLTSSLTGSTHTEVDDEVVDAVGELINIIAGNAKKGLEESFRMVISLPTIVKGAGHQIQWPMENTRIICIPFQIFEQEKFCLLVALEASGK